jgi:membrane protein
MKIINNLFKWFNKKQQKHTFLAFVIAVIKKYNDDSAGTQAALLTYYSFLSIFPLLLVLTTITDTVIAHDAGLRSTIIKGLTNYFPLLGGQLASHVHRLHADGFALVSGLLLTIYGTRGLANSFVNGVQNIWLIPKKDRIGFPKTYIKSFEIIFVGGTGLLLASIIASLASSSGHGFLFKLIAFIVNLALLTGIFIFLLNFSLPKHVKVGDVKSGALVAAVGLLILQYLGGYLLAHELKHLNALYSYFALSLGLLFWLYVQSQVLYYSIEVTVVGARKFWPRSLDNNNLTEIDEKLAILTSQARS